MRDLRWQILIALGGLLLVVGLLLGQKPVLQTDSTEPVSGGVHVEGLIGEPVRLNPVLDFNNQVDEDVDRVLYRALVRFDSMGNPVPDLAERWAFSADAKLLTVTVREDARWHDGEPVEAADVVYTFSRFKEEGFPGEEDLKDFWSEIDIVLLDDRTVQFQLPEPYAPFLDFLSVGLLPDHLLRGVNSTDLPDHPFHLEPIGTGPFQFDRYLREGNEITGVGLTANREFYGQEPFLDRVEFRYFDTAEAALEAYQRGEINGIGSVEPPILSAVLADPSLNLHSARRPSIKVIYLNTAQADKTFLQEPEIRASLQLALNRQAIVDKILSGQGVVAAGPILPGTWAYAAGLEPVPYDPIESAQLLDRMEWVPPTGASPGDEEFIRSKDEVRLAFTLLHLDTPHETALAEMIQSYWVDLGVSVELEPTEADDLQEALEDRDYQAALTDLRLSRWPDPDPYPLWHDSQAETGQNYASWDDRNTGIWLERARTTIDRGQRAELYASFQFRFQNLAPAIVLYHPVYNYAINFEMRGVSVGPLIDPSDRFSTIEEWFLLARRNTASRASTPTP